jgi:hypothetical protein
MMLLYKSQSAARASAPYLRAIKPFHFFTNLQSVAHARANICALLLFATSPCPPSVHRAACPPFAALFLIKTWNKLNNQQISRIKQIYIVK